MRFIVLILFSIAGVLTQAQAIKNDSVAATNNKGKAKIDLSWSTAVPIGAVADEIITTSGRGMQFEIHQFHNERWAFGGLFYWQSFFEKKDVWYFNETSIMSGVQRNYINSVSFLGDAKYYFTTSANGIKAYLSIAAGASIIENYEIFGLYENKELEWHLTLVPGFGVDVPITSNFGFKIYAKYPNSFKTNNSIHYSWLNTGAGIYIDFD